MLHYAGQEIQQWGRATSESVVLHRVSSPGDPLGHSNIGSEAEVVAKIRFHLAGRAWGLGEPCDILLLLSLLAGTGPGADAERT
mmetsp:Transcript_14785/g.20575  ORF Transcript_14785/g.20575 Transcript_14785/m.20575 type:complete len:84 (+) Transcript_14785:287-538(+)